MENNEILKEIERNGRKSRDLQTGIAGVLKRMLTELQDLKADVKEIRQKLNKQKAKPFWKIWHR